MITNYNKTTYQVFAFRNWSVIIYMLVGFIGPLVLFGTTMEDMSIVVLIGLFVILNIVAYFLIKEIGLQPIDIHFNTEKISFDYLSRDLKSIKKKKIILMKYINGFSDFGNKTFRLNLHYGTNFSLYKSDIWNRKDDFEILINDFKDFIPEYNSSFNQSIENDNVKSKKIVYRSFFYTEEATFGFYGAIALAIFVLFKTFSREYINLSDSLLNLLAAFLVLSGLVVYIRMYLVKRKKKNN